MKSKTIAIIACLVIGITLLAENVIAAGRGPAPNSDDFVQDGSGFETTNGPNGNSDSGNGQYGPAPNLGDCILDGNGFESPNGSNGNSDSENGHHGPAPNSGDCIPDGSGW